MRGAAASLGAVLVVAAGIAGPGEGADTAAAAQAAPARFALAGGCYALRARSPGRLVAKAAGGYYAASAGDVAGAERFGSRPPRWAATSSTPARATSWPPCRAPCPC